MISQLLLIFCQDLVSGHTLLNNHRQHTAIVEHSRWVNSDTTCGPPRSVCHGPPRARLSSSSFASLSQEKKLRQRVRTKQPTGWRRDGSSGTNRREETRAVSVALGALVDARKAGLL